MEGAFKVLTNPVLGLFLRIFRSEPTVIEFKRPLFCYPFSYHIITGVPNKKLIKGFINVVCITSIE
jgi:hypothetical protein